MPNLTEIHSLVSEMKYMDGIQMNRHAIPLTIHFMHFMQIVHNK
jgi:hypothetical protein